MSHLTYVTCDPTNEHYVGQWATNNGVTLVTYRMLSEVPPNPDGVVVVDWDFCLDRDRFESLLEQWLGRGPLAVHGYDLDARCFERWRQRGVVVCRYQIEALDGVRPVLAEAA